MHSVNSDMTIVLISEKFLFNVNVSGSIQVMLYRQHVDVSTEKNLIHQFAKTSKNSLSIIRALLLKII